MSSKRRVSHRHSFYGTAAADETRIEKRYNQLRGRRLSAFQEAGTTLRQERDSSATQEDFTYWPSGGLQRKRSNSLPNPTQLNNMVITLENETAAINLSRPRSVSFDPTTKLYTAAAEDDTTELERVLESGKADPNRLYLSGIAPLHIAAAEGHLETIKILVHYGANINILDSEGCSPLEFALRGAHFDCASFLIKVGAETKKIVDGLH